MAELPVRVGHINKAPRVPEGRIRGQGSIASVFQPALEPVPAFPGLQHHDLMIASQCDEIPQPLVGDEPVEHGARIGAAIDVVAQRDDGILRLERHEGSQSVKCFETAVDVANCQVAQRRQLLCLTAYPPRLLKPLQI